MNRNIIRTIIVAVVLVEFCGPAISQQSPMSPNIATEIGNLKSKNLEKKLRAIKYLGSSRDKKAIMALRQELKKQKSSMVKARIVEALAESGDSETVQELVNTARTEPDNQVRYSAVYALRYSKNDEAVATLVNIFENEKEPLGLRLQAGNSLVAYAPREEVYQCFLKGLDDENPAVRSQAIVSLSQGFSGSEKEKIIPVLEKMLADRDAQVAKVARDYLEILQGKK